GPGHARRLAGGGAPTHGEWRRAFDRSRTLVVTIRCSRRAGRRFADCVEPGKDRAESVFSLLLGSAEYHGHEAVLRSDFRSDSFRERIPGRARSFAKNSRERG